MNRAGVRTAIHIAANLVVYLAAAMLVPLAVDLFYGSPDWRAFGLSSAIAGGLGVAVALATRGGSPPPPSTRFGFLLVNLLWFSMALAAALPLLISSQGMSVADAIFEAVSAITTTGSTVMVGLDDSPPGLLLWRSMLQWTGGLGVIALGVFLLPYLKIGGVSYFKIESSDIEDRPFERFTTFTISLLGIYAALTLICAICYLAAGMTYFDALNHALTTISTGGMSTHDASFGHYAASYSLLWIASVFMFAGGLPFSILILFAFRGRYDALRDPQIRVYAGYSCIFAVAVAIYIHVAVGVPFSEAITYSVFNFVSVITTTGYASQDYSLWGSFAAASFFVATFAGGCSGSTAGGIKAYRFLILYESTLYGLRRLIYPHVVSPVRYGARAVDTDMQRSVFLFICAFFVIWGIGTIALSATGLDLVTCMTGMLTALTNVGPGLGDIIGPAGNFSSLSDTAKWILSAAMLLGRLEILVVLVILTPAFWGR